MKKFVERHSYFVYVLVVVSSFLLYHFTFFTSGFPMSHDGTHHLIRSAHYFQLLKEGQWLPYWDGYMNNGFGSPLFNYVPPLVYIISSIFQLLSLSVMDSLKLVVVLFNAIFFIGSYKTLKLFFTTHVSFLATVILFFSPYRISQVFVRGALPEFAALSLTPLFFYLLFKSFKEQNISRNLLLAAFTLCLIFLAHTLLAIQLTLGLAALLLGLLFQKKFRNALQLSGVIVTAMLLSAFLYLPILFELQYVQIFLTDAFPPEHHFSAIWQLFDPGWGLGFSMPGTAEDGMSFQLGVFHWMLIALASLFLIKDLNKQPNHKNTHLQTALMSVFLVSVFLQISSPVTRFLFEHVPIFHRQQFPWRFLNVSILLATFIGATALTRLKVSIVHIVIGCLFIFALSAYYLRPGVFLQLSDAELLTYTSDTTFSHEYTPTGRDSTAEKEYIMTDKAYIIEGGAAINELTTHSHLTEFNINVQSDLATIRINTMFFPGVKLLVDTNEQQFSVVTKKDLYPVEGRDVTNILQTKLPTGVHHVQVVYLPTPWRKIGSWVSISSFILYLVLLAKVLLIQSKLKQASV